MQLRETDRWRPGLVLRAMFPLSHRSTRTGRTRALAGRTYIAVPNWFIAAAIASVSIALIVAGLLVAHPATTAVRSRLHGLFGSSVRTPVDLPGMLTYTVAGDERSSLQAIVADKGSLKAHAVTAGEELYAGAISSPDGSLLAYLHAGCPRCPAAYEVKDLATGIVRNLGTSPLTPPFAGVASGVAWANDGHRLAFVEQGLDSQQPRLFLADLATSERRPLAPSDAQLHAEPVWSPDGSQVAYLAGGASSVVSTVDVATGAVRHLNDQLHGAASLAWSPDGRYLSVLRAGAVWLIEVATGHGFQLLVPGQVRAFGGWAPGSRSVLAVTEETDGTATFRGVMALDVAGAPAQRLTDVPGTSAAHWSADGRYIAWTAEVAGRWTIWTARSTGSGPRQIAAGAGSVSLDDWR